MHPRLKILSIAVIFLIGIGVWMLLNDTPTRNPASDNTVEGIQPRRSALHERPDQTNGVDVRMTPIKIPASAPATAADLHERKLDPRADGWDGEVLGEAALNQLRRILASDAEGGDAWPLSAGFACTPLRPNQRAEVFRTGAMAVHRGEIPQEMTLRGEAALRAQVKAVGVLPGTRVEIKIVRVAPRTDGFSTRALVELFRVDDRRRKQVSARWDCEWLQVEDDGSESGPLLHRLALASYEETVATSGRAMFEDVTHAVIGDSAGYRGQVLRGMNHWAARLTKIDDLHFFGHHGLAIGDANGDGLEDLYLCDGGGLPNRLYLQNADGTVRDASAESGADWLEESKSALFLDLDNDGDQDLVVATVALLLFMENDGRGRFSVHGGIPDLPDPHSMSAADYDNDGDVDLFVCNYGAKPADAGRSGFEATAPIPFHDANNGGRNVLLKNNGKFRFIDATREAGLETTAGRWSFAAAWEDFDDDGDQDLYVSNDFGRNNLFRNDQLPGGGIRFRDVAGELGVEDMASGMSVAWADYNRDGKMDLYVGNMFSAAGNRITSRQRFTGNRPNTAKQLQRMARGNTLFQGSSDGRFHDVSETAAVTMGRWAWSSLFADLNNDGWQDLVVANGYLTNERTDDL